MYFPPGVHEIRLPCLSNVAIWLGIMVHVGFWICEKLCVRTKLPAEQFAPDFHAIVQLLKENHLQVSPNMSARTTMLGLQLQPTPAVSLLLLRSLETNVAQIPRTRPGSLAKSSNSGSLMHRILAKVGKDLGLLCGVFVETSVLFLLCPMEDPSPPVHGMPWLLRLRLLRGVAASRRLEAD